METMDSTPFDEKFHAVLFDLDGVLTPTALIHMRAWEEMFNEELAHRWPSRWANSSLNISSQARM